MRKPTKLVAIVGVLLFLAVAEVARGTIITPPQQLRLEGGSENSAGDWVGGYWVFTVAVDDIDTVIGKVTLPKNTTVNGKEQNTEIKTKKTVEITVKPVQAYYRRLLKIAPMEDRIVTPKVFRGCANTWIGNVWYEKDTYISPTIVSYYQWAEPSWQKYTIFEVSVYVEGRMVGTTTMNTECGSNTVVVPTDKGNVLIKNLGRLEGDFTEPHVPEICLFNEKYIFTTEAIRYIRFDHGATYKYYPNEACALCYVEGTQAYSTYWFGSVRWNPKSVSDKEVAGSPAPFKLPDTAYPVIDGGKGWIAKSGGILGEVAIRDPRAPPIYPEEGSESLLWYLNKMTAEGNIASRWLAGYSWSIEKDSSGNPKAIVVKIPWGKFSGLPVVTIFVPSELAETFVYRPPISDIRIESIKWVGGTEIEDKGSKKCQVQLKQYAKVTSGANIYAESSTSYATVRPNVMTVTMQPNEIKTVEFEVINLGVTSATDGMVVFKVERTWDGVVTSSDKADFKLLPPVVPLPVDENGVGVPGYTIPDYVNRTDPDDIPTPQPRPRPAPAPAPEPEDDGEQSTESIKWWQVVLLVSVVLVVVAVVMALRNRRKSKELAKRGATVTKGAINAVTRPVWKRFGAQIAMIICGAVALVIGWVLLNYTPLANVFNFGRWEPKLGPWTLFSMPLLDSIFGLVSCVVGVILIVFGIGSMARALTRPVVQSGATKLIVKELTEFLKRDEEE